MKIPPYLSLVAGAALTFLPLGAAQAAEPAKILEALTLPANPGILENFVSVYVNKAPVQTEAEAATEPGVIRKVDIKHIGGKRLLVRVEFDQVPSLGDTARYNFYLDADNNAETGRQDENAKGVDLMMLVSGFATGPTERLSVFPPAATDQNSAFHAVFDGKVLYLTIEAPLPESGDMIPLNGWLLVQRNTPAVSKLFPRTRFTLPRGTVQVIPLPQDKVPTVL